MDSGLHDFSQQDLKVSVYDGAAEKRTMYLGDRRYMVKFGYTLDEDKLNSSRTAYINTPVNEFIGSSVFAAAGFDTQKVLLGTYRGHSVVACEDFMQDRGPGDRLIHFKQLEISMPGESGRSKARPEWDFVRHVIEDSPDLDALRGRTMERFLRMTCVDALIGNFDRHSNNWGFITDARSNIIDLAPIYDCGSSLAPHLSDDEMRARLADPSLMREANLASPTMSMNVHGKRHKYAYFLLSDQARDFRRELVDLWSRIGKDVTDRVIDNVPGIDDLHRDFYRATLDARREYVLKPALHLALLAERLATQQFLNGNLTLAKKDKYEIRTRAFIKQKMDRVCEGRAIPRSDVKALELAFAQGLPIYEIRWQRPMPLLENDGRDEMIRQYCAEPGNMDAWVFGLVVHFKTIDGLTSDEIHDAQDEHIIEAVRQYKHNERIGWDQLSTAAERQVEL